MVKKYLNRLFIDGLSGMAFGLFSTLIIGTIICQIASIVGTATTVGAYLNAMGNFAKTITGAGIGVGVACKLKASPLTTVSAAVCGLIGAFPSIATEAFAMGKPGEPLGAFIAAYIAIEIGSLVAGKTKVDIIVTPLASILSGATVAFLVGPYIAIAMKWLGDLVNVNVEKYPFFGGMAISVLMGIILTLPISSAAIGVSMGISGLASGAATIGCCCNMVGFAVMSYRENGWGGLISQGLGTSMLQIPNVMRKPVLFLPPVIASAILGPISTCLFKLYCNASGGGMGTSGLVGVFGVIEATGQSGHISGAVMWVGIVLLMFVAPAIICFLISEIMRKKGIIKQGDLKI